MTIALLAILSCWFIYSYHFNLVPIRSDGYGYYAYLSSVLIDHDLTFRTAIANAAVDVDVQRAYGLGLNPDTGRMFNKYALGVAILCAPFYALGDAITLLFNLPRNGVSIAYQVSAVTAGIFYLVLGAKAVYETALMRTDHFSAMVTTLLIVCATNVAHYATYDLTMPHVYAFALIALYVRELVSIKNNPQCLRIKQTLKLGLLMGLVILVRAPDAIVGVLALLTIMRKWHQEPRTIIIYLFTFVVTVALIAMPLFLYWNYSAGSPFINPYSVLSYGGIKEGFNWFKPQVLPFLFSVSGGYFFWAPVTLLACLGIPLFIKRERLWAVVLVLVFCIEIDIYASWWTWNYGHSVGSRPMVDLMALIALPLTTLIQYTREKFGSVLVTVISIVLIAFNALLIKSTWSGVLPTSNVSLAMILALPYKLDPLDDIERKRGQQLELSCQTQAIQNNRLTVLLTIKNRSSSVLISDAPSGPMRISWRFVNLSDTTQPKPGWDVRENTSFKLQPGETWNQTFVTALPEKPGEYALEITMVRDGVVWFHDLGMEIASMPISVAAQAMLR